MAPFGAIQEDGVRLRLVTGYGADTYSGRAVGTRSQVFTFHGTASFADALVGYQMQLGTLTVKVFADMAGAENQTKPYDPETVIHGLGLGGKAALETWLNLGDRAWTAVDLSWGSLYQSYAGRARLGWRLMPALSVGLEAAHSATWNATSATSGASCATSSQAARSRLPAAHPAISCGTAAAAWRWLRRALPSPCCHG